MAAVSDGATVGLGGWALDNEPVALVRALIRAGKKDLTLVTAPGSIAPDLLIGAGCVSTLFCVFVDFAPLGPAPAFRRAAESGSLRVLDFDLTGLAAGLRAAGASLPWSAVPDFGTDLPRLNPAWYRSLPMADGARVLAVPALAPDVVLLHAQQADYGGNCQLFGATFLDPLLALAGKKVFVSVDDLVDYDALRRAPEKTKIPEYIVDGVVHVPYGAHPTGSHGRYETDLAHLGYYLEAAHHSEGFDRYVAMFVDGPTDHERYLDAIGRSALHDLDR